MLVVTAGGAGTTTLVTISADTGASAFKVYGIVGGHAGTVGAMSAAITNLIQADGTTGTMGVALMASTGRGFWWEAPGKDGIPFDARTNVVLTVAGPASQTTFSIFYTKVYKRP